jgi:DNA-binding transcriptional ArsR family regulator
MEDDRLTQCLVQRASRAQHEARRDEELLRWIARFRFVTADVLAYRFDVSTRRVNARLARLAEAGLVTLHREHVSEPRAVFVTARGAAAVGAARRRAPRPDTHRTHELAIVWLAARTELATAGRTDLRVVTEREARSLEAAGSRRYSADIAKVSDQQERRWPDLVLESSTRRVAVEIELAPKGATRLRGIVEGYAAAPWFDEVRFLVRDERLARRLGDLALCRPAAEPAGRFTARPAVAIVSWRGRGP